MFPMWQALPILGRRLQAYLRQMLRCAKRGSQVTVIRWITEGRLKREDCSTRWDGDGYKDVVLSEDYDALAAELATARKLALNQAKIGVDQETRIKALEAALTKIAGEKCVEWAWTPACGKCVGCIAREALRPTAETEGNHGS